MDFLKKYWGIIVGGVVAIAVAALVIYALFLQHTTPPVPNPPSMDLRLILPDKLTGEVGDFVNVVADTNGKCVKWYSTSNNLKVFPYSKLANNSDIIVIGKSPGIYTLLAVTHNSNTISDIIYTTITITGPPGPVPPTPVPPGPQDQLLTDLKASYATETDKTKKDILITAYKSIIASQIDDPSITTVGSFINITDQGTNSLMGGATVYLGMRKIIATYIGTKLPNMLTTAPLTPALRVQIKSVFQDVLNHLTAI